MNGIPGRRGRFWLGSLVLVLAPSPRDVAEGGGRFVRKSSQPVVTVQSVPLGVRPTGTLGTFYPNPTIFVRGNGTAGGGYSPLGMFGDTTLTLYGPHSSLGRTSAPVATYSRGYDGRAVVTTSTSFSYPNQPALTPVVYPTQANDYYGFRNSGTPPWWQNGINWIDQN